MTTKQAVVKVTRWNEAKHPTLPSITRLMQQDGMRPYRWGLQSNQRFAVRSHGYTKILYVVDGTLEISLPDSNQRMKLHAGDRVEIPPRVRHGGVTHKGNVICLEAALP